MLTNKTEKRTPSGRSDQSTKVVLWGRGLCSRAVCVHAWGHSLRDATGRACSSPLPPLGVRRQPLQGRKTGRERGGAAQGWRWGGPPDYPYLTLGFLFFFFFCIILLDFVGLTGQKLRYQLDVQTGRVVCRPLQGASHFSAHPTLTAPACWPESRLPG